MHNYLVSQKIAYMLGLCAMIDTHVHLHLINRSPAHIISDARQAGVKKMVQVSIDMESFYMNIDNFYQMEHVYITGGIHPLSVASTPSLEEALHVIRSHRSSIIAIGEIGLDYKYGWSQAAIQKRFFIAQLELARDLGLPVIIHSRKADQDVLDIVNQFPLIKKVFHCYATTPDFFNALKGENNYVSFTGMITTAKKGKMIRSVQSLPLNRMMIETDAPYLLPKGVSASQNEPKFVGAVANRMAELRQVSVDMVCESTTAVACQFFGIQC